MGGRVFVFDSTGASRLSLYQHPVPTTQTTNTKQGIYFMADSYEHFLRAMVIKATTTVVLLVNPAASTHNILPVAGTCVPGA